MSVLVDGKAGRLMGWRVLAVLLGLLVLLVPEAWADRNFAARYSINTNGDLLLIGNTMLTCDTAVANCTTAQGGGSYRNNDFNMINVDIDSDSSTFNSSQSDLDMPVGSTVVFAGLYWSGESTASARSQVLFKTATSFGYSTVNAQVLDTSSGNVYQAFANVTAAVAAAGSGSYRVANVQTATAATDIQSGWTLIVVYRNNSLPLRNLTVFDGLISVSATTITIPVNGFLTPLSGPVTTRLGVLTYDGDRSATGDTLSLNGTAVSDAANPSNNFYNSTIADLGVNVTARSPNFVNTLGLDLDRVNVPAGVLGNGATSATIEVTSPSTNEVFWLGAVTFATDLYVPIITPNIVKTATDVNGGNLVAGDILRWTISLSNTGLDTATNVTLTDPIPNNVTYSTNSLRVLTGANAGAKTDASGDDQAEYFGSGPARIVMRLGTGANASAGGNIPYTEATSVQFDTIVNAGLAAGTPIDNTVTVGYAGQTIGDTYSGTGAAASAVVVGPAQIGKSFSPATIDVGGVAQLTLTVSNPAANPVALTGVNFSDTYPSGLINAATPNAQVSCTAGSTAGTITGGTAGGNSVGMTGATLNPNGSCTVTVNVTSNTVGNYTNTTGNVGSGNAGTGSTASATISVGKPSITKAFAPTSIVSGGTSTITFTLSNPGLVALTGVAFSDTMTSMTVATTPAVSNTCGGTVTATAGTGSISLSGGSLAASGSCTVKVNVTSSTGGILPNTTTGVSSTQSGAAGNPSNTAYLTVVAPPVISKSFSPTSVGTGVPSTMTITVSNPNTSTTITGMAFTDTYPTNLINDTPANPTLNCSSGSTATRTGGANAGTTVGMSGGSLAPNGSCTVTVNVDSTTAGNYVNSTGTVTTTNAGTGSAASATLNVTALTALTATKAFGAATIPVNGTTTLTITLSNPNNAAITGIAFTDNYPLNMVNAATPAAATTCGGTVTAVAGGSSLALTGGGLAARPGASGTFSTCTVTVTITSADGGSYTNTTGTMTTANAGTIAAAQATLNVLAPPQVSKTFAPTAISTGATSFSVLTITLSNPTTATVSLAGVALTDVFPTNMVVHSTPNASTTCPSATLADSNGNSLGSGDVGVRITGGTLAPNATCTIVVNVRSGTTGSYTNTTNAVTTTNAGNGSTASAVLTVGRPNISKAFGTTTIASGASTVLTITLSNPTGTAMTTAAFTDTYPTNMTNTATPSGATTCGGTVTAAANGGSVALSGGTIPANGSCTVTVNVTATESVINTIPAGGLTTNGGSNGNAATASLGVYKKPDVLKEFTPNVVLPSTNSRLAIVLTNGNSVAATTVAFTDSYPSGLVNAPTPNATTTCSGTVTAAAGGASLALSGGTIPANSSCRVEVDVRSATAANYLNNSGTVTTANIGSGASVSATLTVMGPPTLAKSFSPSTVLVNEESTLTITLTNPNTVAVTGAALTDSYPSNLVNATTPNASTSCSGGTLSATAGGTSVAISGATIPASGSCTISIRVLSATAGSYVNSTGSVTTTNAGTGTAASATLTVNRPMPSLSLLKLVSVVSDPFNGATNPKSIPGAISAYSIRVTNSGPGTVDSNTLVMTDPIPANTSLYVGNIGGAGTGPVVFTNGSPTSGLSWTYTSLASTTDNLDFSNNNGSTWTYTPVPDANGFDAAVTNVRMRPQGSMNAAAGGNPYIEFLFRVRIK